MFDGVVQTETSLTRFLRVITRGIAVTPDEFQDFCTITRFRGNPHSVIGSGSRAACRARIGQNDNRVSDRSDRYRASRVQSNTPEAESGQPSVSRRGHDTLRSALSLLRHRHHIAVVVEGHRHGGVVGLDGDPDAGR